MSEAKYRVGNAANLKDTDPYFDDEKVAIEEAEKIASNPRNYNAPIAVWDHWDDIIHLFMFGKQFRSV